MANIKFYAKPNNRNEKYWAIEAVEICRIIALYFTITPYYCRKFYEILFTIHYTHTLYRLLSKSNDYISRLHDRLFLLTFRRRLHVFTVWDDYFPCINYLLLSRIKLLFNIFFPKCLIRKFIFLEFFFLSIYILRVVCVLCEYFCVS